MKTKLLLLIILFSTSLEAQIDTLHVHYFDNGKVSTISFIESNKWGKAFAYNKEGEVIYQKEIRRFAGSASVVFNHYPSGEVKRAKYSSYPDGGIQWHKSEIHFSEQGKIINESVDESDHMGRPNVITTRVNTQKDTTENLPSSPQKHEPRKEKEVVVCAALHENIIEFTNHTAFKIELKFTHRQSDSVVILDPSEKVEGPTYISAEISSPLNQNINMQFKPLKKRKKVSYLTTSRQTDRYKTVHSVHIFESTID